ncbi:MAG: hypothetical protein HKN12_05515, partial [Gemmatimonadetes bacterium]|nr:hypothetical protein [Gemmatimonadota bacterium]
PEPIREPARIGLIIMTPWTWSIAYRRFQQGVMIRFGRSGLVGVGTLVRLVVIVAVLAAGYVHGGFSGIVVGTAAVAAGVLAEAAFAAVVVRPILRNRLPETAPDTVPLHRKSFLAFYIPLALTSILALFSLPLGSAAMGRLPHPIASLAVWPVLNGLTFTLRSLGHAYNEVVVALLDEPGSYPALRRFAWILGLGTTAVMALIAATPASHFWFRDVSNLSPELTALAGSAIWVALLLPALSVTQHWFQGLLTQARETRAVGEAILIFLLTSASVLAVAILQGRTPGIYVGLAATTAGYLVQSAWLAYRSGPVRKRLRARDADPVAAPTGPSL